MNEGNNRKLIGTIIGVIFFIVLIAGATFAWLTYTANVNNGIYNVATSHFIVNYTSDTDVTNLPILPNEATMDDFNNANGDVITGQAYKDTVDGTLYLKLHVNDTPGSNALVAAGCIRYYASYVTSLFAINPIGALENNPGSGIVNTASMDSNRDIVILETPLSSTSTFMDQTIYPGYKILFWIDNSLITNSEDGLSFSGYVHASAVQKDPAS